MRACVCVKFLFIWHLCDSASSSSASLRLGVSRMRTHLSTFFPGQCGRRGPQGEGEILRTVTKVKEEENHDTKQ